MKPNAVTHGPGYIAVHDSEGNQRSHAQRCIQALFNTISKEHDDSSNGSVVMRQVCYSVVLYRVLCYI